MRSLGNVFGVATIGTEVQDGEEGAAGQHASPRAAFSANLAIGRLSHASENPSLRSVATSTSSLLPRRRGSRPARNCSRTGLL